MVARGIREQLGYEIDRRKIQLPEDMKELGSFKAKVDFGNNNEAEITLELNAEA
jgi:large subunit ribosomal protein L9